ncbi:MAG: GYF domain-containing protein [Puniceicoccales bacterium]
MEWYYAEGNERRGPVTQAELGRLVHAGAIAAETLVWRDGLPQWTPYQQVSAAPASAVAPPQMPTRQMGNGSSIRIPSLTRKGVDMPLPDDPVVSNYGRSYAQVEHHLHLYPAILRKEELVQGRAVLEDGEASCFYHPNFAATNVCDHSGRFICDLCSVDWEGGTVSLQALEEIKRGGKSDKLQGSRTMWDGIALALTALPLISVIFWFALIVTAPVALFICLWKYREGPTSITSRSRWRYLVAGILAVLEIAGLVLFFIGMMGEW